MGNGNIMGVGYVFIFRLFFFRLVNGGVVWRFVINVSFDFIFLFGGIFFFWLFMVIVLVCYLFKCSYVYFGCFCIVWLLEFMRWLFCVYYSILLYIINLVLLLDNLDLWIVMIIM